MSKINALEFGEYVENCYQSIKDTFSQKNLGTPSSLRDAILIENNIVSQSYNLGTTGKYDPKWPDIRNLLDEYTDVPAAAVLLPDNMARYTTSISSGALVRFIFSDDPSTIISTNNHTHYWDFSKDLDYPGEICKLRWVILYGGDNSSKTQNSILSSINSIVGSYNMAIAIILKNFTVDASIKAEYGEIVNCNIPILSCNRLYNFVNNNSSIGKVNPIAATATAASGGAKFALLDSDLFPFIQSPGTMTVLSQNNTSLTIDGTPSANISASFCKDLIYSAQYSSCMCRKSIYENIASTGTALYQGPSYLVIKKILSSSSYWFVWLESLISIKYDTDDEITCVPAINTNGSSGTYLSIRCIVAIAEKLKNLINETASSWSLSAAKNQIQYVYVKEIDGHLTIVDQSTDGAITLTEYITNKNWTIG